MRSCKLGDLEAPAVGCGDVNLARAAARGVDPREVEQAVGEAIERGVAVVEVAREDASERLVGEAVRALRARDRAVIATRIDIGWRWRPEVFHAQLEASLRATRLDVLPLVVIAIDADLFAVREWHEIADLCAQRTKAGDVVRWGAMIIDDALDAPLAADDAAARSRRVCAELAANHFVALQRPFNLCERDATWLAAARDAGLAMLAARPLAGGALTGVVDPVVELAPRIALGIAKLAAYVQIEPPAARATDAARAQLERNPKLPDRDCRTVAELALRFVIDRGAIALPRLHRRAYVAEAIAAASALPLHFDPTNLDI